MDLLCKSAHLDNRYFMLRVYTYEDIFQYPYKIISLAMKELYLHIEITSIRAIYTNNQIRVQKELLRKSIICSNQ